MAGIAQIWRHPVKGVGAETLDAVTLDAGRPMPGDRAFAILTGDAEDTGAWQPCRNFARGCYGPSLMAVTAQTGQAGITFRHPDRPEITLDPARDGARLVEWITPIYPPERPAPHTVIPPPGEGMADAHYASISILGVSGLAQLSKIAGTDMDPRRFRGNLWIDGLTPFEEFDWVGRSLRIGEAEFDVIERIGRCHATEANPNDGTRDIDTLALLRQNFGHTDFGVKARVTRSGRIATGDTVTLL